MLSEEELSSSRLASEGTSYGIVPFMNRKLGLESIKIMHDSPLPSAAMATTHLRSSKRCWYVRARKQLAVVSALVGAGGNLGAVTRGGRNSCRRGRFDEAAGSQRLIILLFAR